MKENIYGVSDEVLEHYRKMNWKVRQAMLNTSVTLGLGPDFVKKIIETCYHGKYPGTQEESDRQIVWDHMKWNSKAAAETYRCWLESMTEEEQRMQSLKGVRNEYRVSWDYWERTPGKTARAVSRRFGEAYRYRSYGFGEVQLRLGELLRRCSGGIGDLLLGFLEVWG